MINIKMFYIHPWPMIYKSKPVRAHYLVQIYQ